MTDDAIIVSTARTPIGKAYRGAFNDTQGTVLAAHAGLLGTIARQLRPAVTRTVPAL